MLTWSNRGGERKRNRFGCFRDMPWGLDEEWTEQLLEYLTHSSYLHMLITFPNLTVRKGGLGLNHKSYPTLNLPDTTTPTPISSKVAHSLGEYPGNATNSKHNGELIY